jgi:hypothetical protein
MKEFQLTSAQEQCLRDQTITEDQPGALLRDFRMLLDFLGRDGVESGGKYHTLPIRAIGELDRRLTRPLNLELKRPQLRSHPYIQGLNLLLRASGLSLVETTENKARLVTDPAMLVQWNQLNATEQYFNLLEAWLRIGRPEMAGDAASSQVDLLPRCVGAWHGVATLKRRIDDDGPQSVVLTGFYHDLYNLALCDLFGLIKVEHARPPAVPWCPAGVSCLPFGDAVFTVLSAELLDSLGMKYRLEEEEDDGPEEETLLPRFGVWQPLFQPYFPDWRENLELPAHETREGTFVFRVSLSKVCWRLIAMPADATLDDLVSIILHSVNFDDDHLYAFTYRDRFGVNVRAFHPLMDDGPCAEDVAIGTLPLELGQTMELHYDFGDDWRFAIKLERIDPPGAKSKAPRILEKHGKSPAQYPASDY